MTREQIASESRNVVAGYEGSWAECPMTNFLDQRTRVCSGVGTIWEISAPRDGPARRSACAIGGTSPPSAGRGNPPTHGGHRKLRAALESAGFGGDTWLSRGRIKHEAYGMNLSVDQIGALL
jgi:hypothetical protein